MDKQVYAIKSCARYTAIQWFKLTISTQKFTKTFEDYLTQNSGWIDGPTGLELKMISPVAPLYSMVNAKFITDGTNTALLDDPHYAATKVLACPNAEAAKNFQCSLALDACQCHSAESAASCVCRDNNFSAAYEHNTLPLIRPGLILTDVEDGKITAQFPLDSSIQFAFKMRAENLEHFYKIVEIVVAPRRLTGCYGCAIGALFEFICTSIMPTHADIKCRNVRFPANCNSQGAFNAVRLNLNDMHVNETCKVSGPGSTSKFRLEGNLFTISEPENGWKRPRKIWLRAKSMDAIPLARSPWELVTR